MAQRDVWSALAAMSGGLSSSESALPVQAPTAAEQIGYLPSVAAVAGLATKPGGGLLDIASLLAPHVAQKRTNSQDIALEAALADLFKVSD